MAATRPGGKGGALQALLHAALALPVVAVPARAGAADVGEIGITFLGYKERGLMKVSEPVVWGKALVAEVWEVQASAAIDIVTGASPDTVTNVTGKPVQTVSGASISERRTTWDVKVGRRFQDFTFSLSQAQSEENDYLSRAWGMEAKLDLNDRSTTLVAGFGRSNDRVKSHDDPLLDQPRYTNEYLAGVTQVLSPVAIVQSTVTLSRGNGWYNDPYKFTFTFFPEGGVPAFLPDTRPSERNTLAWLTRYRHHFPGLKGTLHADYRFYRDDWGIRAHTLEAAWHQTLNDNWAIRPGLRYQTQSAADFYSPVIPRPIPQVLSSDQRLASFGGVSPSVRVIFRTEEGLTIEAMAGYLYNAASLRFGGGGTDAYVPLRAAYGLLSFSRSFY